MATKAERFRYEAERTRKSTKKQKKRKNAAAAAQRGPSRGRKATVAFEETPPAVPASRKSTRRSKHRQKAAIPLTGRNMLAKTSPQTRHDIGPTNLRAPR